MLSPVPVEMHVVVIGEEPDLAVASKSEQEVRIVENAMLRVLLPTLCACSAEGLTPRLVRCIHDAKRSRLCLIG